VTRVNETATLIEKKEKGIWVQMYDDPYNKRIRVDDFYGNTKSIIEYVEKVMKRNKREKLIIKVRQEQFNNLLEYGYTCEAMIEQYFQGSDMYFFTKYFEMDRMKSDNWITEDQILNSIHGLKLSLSKISPPNVYEWKKADDSDAEQLADLYQKVFKIYPTPLHNSMYIKETIRKGTIYYAFSFNGKFVSAASAEVNGLYRNAELTDCATLPEHRKHGLMKILLKKLEEELYDQGIYCSYSIARSLSFGMNAALYQLGYRYSGRLRNNVFIYDKIENMNVWVKDLAN
jgi:beta-lysine N6-acetyltransferase